jgi:hypothetical protein
MPVRIRVVSSSPHSLLLLPRCRPIIPSASSRRRDRRGHSPQVIIGSLSLDFWQSACRRSLCVTSPLPFEPRNGGDDRMQPTLPSATRRFGAIWANTPQSSYVPKSRGRTRPSLARIRQTYISKAGLAGLRLNWTRRACSISKNPFRVRYREHIESKGVFSSSKSGQLAWCYL